MLIILTQLETYELVPIFGTVQSCLFQVRSSSPAWSKSGLACVRVPLVLLTAMICKRCRFYMDQRRKMTRRLVHLGWERPVLWRSNQPTPAQQTALSAACDPRRPAPRGQRATVRRRLAYPESLEGRPVRRTVTPSSSIRAGQRESRRPLRGRATREGPRTSEKSKSSSVVAKLESQGRRSALGWLVSGSLST